MSEEPSEEESSQQKAVSMAKILGALNISSLTGLNNVIPQLGLAMEVWGRVIIQQEQMISHVPFLHSQSLEKCAEGSGTRPGDLPSVSEQKLRLTVIASAAGLEAPFFSFSPPVS